MRLVAYFKLVYNNMLKPEPYLFPCRRGFSYWRLFLGSNSTASSSSASANSIQNRRRDKSSSRSLVQRQCNASGSLLRLRLITFVRKHEIMHLLIYLINPAYFEKKRRNLHCQLLTIIAILVAVANSVQADAMVTKTEETTTICVHLFKWMDEYL